MKIMCIHAHFDDFEFVAAGTFEMWRRRLGGALAARLVVCTDGTAGHHFRSREETGRVRLEEQLASARIGNYELAPLRLPDGSSPREASLRVTIPLMAAIWKAIRDFEPDYLFCPPLPRDPLAGIHVDHAAVAQAVREVAYMINVPHAFSPEYPADETRSTPCKVPVILNTYDSYQFGSNGCDLAVEVEEAFDLVARMAWCHQSQVCEWLPWVGRHQMPVPASLEEFTATLRRHSERRNGELGLPPAPAVEAFTVTAWGIVPTLARLTRDFPGLSPRSNLAGLGQRLERWGAGT